MAFASWLKATSNEIVDPDSIFDSQIKRIHEYKRQLLNVLHVVMLYNRLRANPNYAMTSAYLLLCRQGCAGLPLRQAGHQADQQRCRHHQRRSASVRGRLKVLFLPEYNVSLAERLIPASDVSEQISTAGYEASGTGNMKFMMNGALTIGTRDGATIEMAREAGEDNFFLFGLTAAQVADSAGWYDPNWHYANEPETREALDLIVSDHFSPADRGVFLPVRRALLDYKDHYRHLADLTDYSRAHRELDQCYADPEAVVAQGDIQRRLLRQVLQRSHDQGICRPDLGPEDFHCLVAGASENALSIRLTSRRFQPDDQRPPRSRRVDALSVRRRPARSNSAGRSWGRPRLRRPAGNTSPRHRQTAAAR